LLKEDGNCKSIRRQREGVAEDSSFRVTGFCDDVILCYNLATFKSPTYARTHPQFNFMAKKRKLSGLSGADLVLTIEAIERLQRSLIYEESETEEGETDDLGGGLADVLSLLKAKVGGTKV